MVSIFSPNQNINLIASSLYVGWLDQVYPPPAVIGIGQSSSVILLQKIQTVTTPSNVKKVSNNAPLIFP